MNPEGWIRVHYQDIRMMLNKFLFRTECLYVLSLLLTIVSIVAAGYDMVAGAGGLMPLSNGTFIGALVLFIVGIILDRKR